MSLQKMKMYSENLKDDSNRLNTYLKKGELQKALYFIKDIENCIDEIVFTVTVAVPFGIVAKPVIGAKPRETSLLFTADNEI